MTGRRGCSRFMRKDKTRYLERVQAQIEKAEGITFLVPDDTGFFSLEDDLIPRVRSLMEETLELTRELGDLYDAESHTPTPACVGSAAA
jgi:hypothetical protein